MSDTTWDECKCCRHDTDCIEGLCIECREYNYKLQKQVDLLTLGLLEEKRKMGDKPKCKTCNDTGVYEHTIVTGEILPVKCLHGAVKYPNAKPIAEHPDVQRLITQVEALKKFVQQVADAYATGGDPDEECILCRGELQDAAEQVLKGE